MDSLNFDTNNMHRFTVCETHLMLDINSGTVHLLDEISWGVLEALEQHHGNISEVLIVLSSEHSKEEVMEVLGELKELKEQGLLGSEAVHHDFTPDYELKSLCLNVSHDCNLRCRYCFAGTGHFGGSRSLMELETGRAAIDLLLKESKRHFCELDFFGGEPLLNFNVVKELVSYGKEKAKLYQKEIRFTLTTNATLLDDEMISFLNREGMQVVLSLDGRKTVHDAKRPVPGGGGSYEETVSRIQRFAASGHSDYYVRGTFTSDNLDFSKDVLHLLELGLNDISLEPVVTEHGKSYVLKEEHLPKLEAEYERLAQIYLEHWSKGKPFNFFHFNVSLDGGPCLPKRLTNCGAGYQYLAVAPNGKLYPCHQFVEQEEYLLGNVWEGINRSDISDRFRRNTVQHKQKCASCWARYHCSGGCQANSHLLHGKIEAADALSCSLMKKRLECALYVQARMKLNKMEG